MAGSGRLRASHLRRRPRSRLYPSGDDCAVAPMQLDCEARAADGDSPKACPVDDDDDDGGVDLDDGVADYSWACSSPCSCSTRQAPVG